MTDPDVRIAMNELKRIKRNPDYKYGPSGMRERVLVRAKKKGLEFDLTVEWFKERLDRGTCAVTGIEFQRPDPDYIKKHSSDPMGASPWQASVDRVDPQFGYTMDNCQLVCFIYNTCKGRFSDETVVTMAKALISKQ